MLYFNYIKNYNILKYFCKNNCVLMIASIYNLVLCVYLPFSIEENHLFMKNKKIITFKNESKNCRNNSSCYFINNNNFIALPCLGVSY